jgi:hypothetical protein
MTLGDGIFLASIVWACTFVWVWKRSKHYVARPPE